MVPLSLSSHVATKVDSFLLYSMENIPQFYYHPLTVDHPAVYRLIRLRALSESPSNFSSTFEREVAFTRDKWIERLKNPNAITFVASNRAALLSEEADTATSWESPKPDELEASDKWLYGIVTCIQSYDDPDEAFLVSFWVAPSVRRREVGTTLVKLALEWAANESQHSKFVRIILDVLKENATARRLYESCGFVMLGESEEDPDEFRYIYEI